MQPENIKSKIPEQFEGAQSNNEVTREFESAKDAVSFYKTVLQRFTDINAWQKYAAALSAEFQLCDHQGNPKDGEPIQSDMLKISIPGPGNSAGDGFDWVRVEEVKKTNTEKADEMMMRVRPCENPGNSKKEIAHFFDEDATSSFVVSRSGNIVKAGIYGRNEKPNTDPGDIINKTRNLAVAGAAATLFSKIQWKGLVEGWMEIEKG